MDEAITIYHVVLYASQKIESHNIVRGLCFLQVSEENRDSLVTEISNYLSQNLSK